MTAGYKTCAHCRLYLPTSSFAARKTATDGLQSYCRDCNTLRGRLYRSETPEVKAARKAERLQRKLGEYAASQAHSEARNATRLAEIAKRQSEGKVCGTCRAHKPPSEFRKNRSRMDGLADLCKACHAAKSADWKARNEDKVKAYWAARNQRPEVREAKNARRRKDRIARGTSRTEHYGHFLQWQRHCADIFFALFDPHDAHVAAYTAEQKEVRKRSMQALKSDANAHVSAYRRRRRTGRELRTRRDIHANIYVAFKGWVRKRLKHAIPEGFTWATLFPYSPADVAQHLESKFLPGMGWHNRSDWHIDHIRPISSFGIDHWDSDAWKACFALENLQPLWATDNIKKGARVS